MEAFFLTVGATRRFCLYHPAVVALRGAWVHVHPFGEEMNLSRRMAALQARAFAQAGYAVLQIDLFGCGDSEGAFGAADWQTWISDIVEAADWLRQRTAIPVGLWGVRTGCLLAGAVARRVSVQHLVFWQPVLSGADDWRQLKRLYQMSALVSGRVPQYDQSNASIEIAGYEISPALAAGLQAERLVLPEIHDGRVICVEVGAAAEISLPLAQALNDWQTAGWRILAEAVSGDAFWQIPEAPDAPDLVATTLHLLMKASERG